VLKNYLEKEQKYVQARKAKKKKKRNSVRKYTKLQVNYRYSKTEIILGRNI
jgi:hypothetical protein